jgi:hypothetical protein
MSATCDEIDQSWRPLLGDTIDLVSADLTEPDNFTTATE